MGKTSVKVYAAFIKRRRKDFTENGTGSKLNFFDTTSTMRKALEIAIMILLILCGGRTTNLFLSWRGTTEADTADTLCFTWMKQLQGNMFP